LTSRPATKNASTPQPRHQHHKRNNRRTHHAHTQPHPRNHENSKHRAQAEAHATNPSYLLSAETFPAAISRSRAICVHVRRRTGAIAALPRNSSSSVTGGNPAVPSSEFTSARFSARNRATSCSSIRTYRLRAFRETHSANFFQPASSLPIFFASARTCARLNIVHRYNLFIY